MVWLIDWLIFNFGYRRYPAMLLIPVVHVPTSSEREFNIHVYDTGHGATAYLPQRHNFEEFDSCACWFCNWHSPNTNFYGTTFGGMPGSVNSSQIMRLWNRNVRTSVYSLYRRTRAAQNVAPEWIRTQHLLHARQVSYPLATAPSDGCYWDEALMSFVLW